MPVPRVRRRIGFAVSLGQHAGKDRSYLHPHAAGLEHGPLEDGLREGDLDIAAGTAWVWAREQFQGTVDTLFVDLCRCPHRSTRPARCRWPTLSAGRGKRASLK